MINKLFVGDSNTDYALFMDDDMVDKVYLGDTQIYSKPANIYGWHVDPSISDPSDAITYIRDAMGKTPSKITNIQQTADGYYDLEYIKSTGTQMISTDIVPANNTKVVLDIKLGTALHYSDSSVYDSMIFGVLEFNGDNNSEAFFSCQYNYLSTGSQLYYLLGFVSFSSDNEIDNPTMTTRNILTAHRGGSSWGSSSVNVTTAVTKQNPTKGLSLFGTHCLDRPGFAEFCPFSVYEMYLYGCTIYDNNNNKVAELIPVERVSDNVLGLYDTISNNFYTNVGTGTFIKGSYITTADYWFDYGDWKNAFFMPKPCMLKSNGIVDYYLDPNDYSKKLEDGTMSDISNTDYDGNAMMEWPLIYYKFEGLEDKGYKAVEYIQNSKTQYILTDIPLSYDYTYEAIGCIIGTATDTSAFGTLFGSYIDSAQGIETMGGSLSVQFNNNGSVYFYSGYTWQNPESNFMGQVTSPSTKATITLSRNKNSSWVDINGNTVSKNISSITKVQPDPLVTLPIFGGWDIYNVRIHPYGRYGQFRVYSFKVYDNNNVLINSLIPVERTSDNELGLYDIITDKFYTNSGTGTFIKGTYVETGDGWFYCSDRKVNNSYKCWCNYNANNEIGQHFYTAIYNGTGTSKMRSISGVQLTQANGSADVSGSDELTRALSNNTQSGVEWYTEVWSDRILINALLILVGKSINTQAIFGNGLVTGLQTAKSNYITGTLNDKGLFWGDISGLNNGVKVFGMENYWGCVWRRVAGLIGTSTGFAYKLTYGIVDGTTTTGYNSTANGYLSINKKPNSSNLVKTMSFGKYGFLPYTVGGTSSTYWSDWYADNTSGYVMVGGASYGENYVGAFYLALGYSFTTVNDLISSALSCKPYFIGLPKINTPNVRISKEKVVDFITSSSATVEAQLYVQDVSDLPEYNSLTNRTLLAGSTAIVIATCELYMLNSNNEWIFQGTAI